MGDWVRICTGGCPPVQILAQSPVSILTPPEARGRLFGWVCGRSPPSQGLVKFSAKVPMGSYFPSFPKGPIG